MCGIVGYIGKRQALPVLLEGIKTLEYRGYDSAGLAIFNGDKIEVQRAVGRVANLERKMGENPIAGSSGIVHSRWATHGIVSEANAHPHADCKGEISVVHNGIIENYKELKEELQRKGHVFASETDTETLAHLIEEHYPARNAKQGAAGGRASRSSFLPLEDAVRRALREVRGTYGLAIISAREPDKLIAVRNFSPLLVGIGKGEHFIASDASAVLPYTRKVIYMEDGEMALLTPKGFKIFDIDNHLRSRKPQKLEWDVEKIQKGGYPHFMLKEIFEQPEAIINSTRGRIAKTSGQAVLGGLMPVMKELQNMRRLIVVGCGTAYLAGRVGEYMIEEFARLPVEVDLASEFRYRKPVFEKGDVLLAVSQSGETADTLAALREAKEQKVLTLGIVNVVGSTMARETDAGVYQHVGPEIAVASTKAFTSQVSIFALISVLLGRNRGLAPKTAKALTAELRRMPKLVGEVLKASERIKEIAAEYQKFRNFIYIGRKYNFPAAMEGALKLKEISYVHAEGMSAGEMKHGSIAMIDGNFPTVAIAPLDSVYDKNISNIEEIKARGGPVLAIATEGDRAIKKIADHVIYIPKTLEMFTPLLAVPALQLFAYHFAVLRGCDVDKPRNLAKSVTVE